VTVFATAGHPKMYEYLHLLQFEPKESEIVNV